MLILGFPGGSVYKQSACNAGDPGSIPGSRKEEKTTVRDSDMTEIIKLA